MTEEHDPPEMTEIVVAVDTMPVSVFEELWSGLCQSEEAYGDPSGRIRQAKNWLNVTMQGGEWEALCDWMYEHAPEPEPPDPEPPDDWDEEGDWDE